MKKMKRVYTVITVLTLALVCMAFTQGCCKQPSSKKPALVFDNASFYNADGTFNVEAGRDAYIALMKYHGYPVFDGLRE